MFNDYKEVDPFYNLLEMKSIHDYMFLLEQRLMLLQSVFGYGMQLSDDQQARVLIEKCKSVFADFERNYSELSNVFIRISASNEFKDAKLVEALSTLLAHFQRMKKDAVINQ